MFHFCVKFQLAQITTMLNSPDITSKFLTRTMFVIVNTHTHKDYFV
jgi:hypothetical protein